MQPSSAAAGSNAAHDAVGEALGGLRQASAARHQNKAKRQPLGAAGRDLLGSVVRADALGARMAPPSTLQPPMPFASGPTAFPSSSRRNEAPGANLIFNRQNNASIGARHSASQPVPAAPTPSQQEPSHTVVAIQDPHQVSLSSSSDMSRDLHALLHHPRREGTRRPHHETNEKEIKPQQQAQTTRFSSVAIRIEIPPLLESASPQNDETLTTNGTPLVTTKPEPQPRKQPDDRHKPNQDRAIPRITATASPAHAMTSAFLQRKQPYLTSRESTESKHQRPHVPHRVFFHDAPESPSSTCKRAGDKTLNSDTTDTEDERPEPLPTHMKNEQQQPHTSFSGTSSSGGSTMDVIVPLHDRIGELSRDEDEFDFAILLKPSKHEEHLDMPAGDDERPGLADVGAPSFGQRYRRTSVFANQNADASQATALPRPSFVVPSGKDLNAAKNPTRARQLIMARIQRTGLHVKRLLSLDGKQTLLKVKAPQHVLERGAEQLKLRKLRKFDQIWMAFSCELRTTFADYDDREDAVRFLDSEKQSIVHWLLTTSSSSDDISNQEEGHGSGGAGLNEFCPLKSKYVVHMFPLHKQDLAALKRHWVTFWRASVPQNPNSNKDDSGGGSGGGSCCYRFARGALRQPIDDVAQYFGEHVAFYFAWMEMYTKWLIGPSVVGLILFCLQVTSKRIDHPVAPLYAMFMALWTSAFLIAWMRRASTLAYKWGTLGYEDVETTRAEFYGDPAVSTQTHKRYPSWRRYLKYAVTLPLVLLSINVTLVLTYAAFSTRDRLEAKAVATQVAAAQLAKDLLFHNVTSSASPLSGSTNETVAEATTTTHLDRLSSLGLLDWRFWVYLLVTPLLYGLLIPILDAVFTRCARAMTNWENHKTTSRYQSHLILKVVAFRFMHVFASLYYYAFADLTTHKSDNLLRVAIQLASFMVAGQLWKNVMETLLPFVQRKWRRRQKKRATNAQFTHSTVFNNSASSVNNGGGQQRNRRSVLLAGIELHNTNAVIHEQCVRLEQASDKAWEEAELEPYDTFEDYTEMLIQFGYVSFFSLAFPLAPLLALANNVLELRTDAFKLCHAKQRPIARKASGIGVWFHVLQLMSVLAVLTNCLHIAFTTSFIDDLANSSSGSSGTTTTKVWVAFGVEHVLLAVKVWMMAVIPSMPKDVQDRVLIERERTKEESARAMIAKLRLLPEASDAAGGATADVAAAPRETVLDKNDRAVSIAGAMLVDLRRRSSKDTKTNQI